MLAEIDAKVKVGLRVELHFDLRQLQLAELEVLIEFDRICRKHDLKYQLAYGTLIGAIRHKGFIPWDDDIDVLMLRKDYNKFMKICKEELNSAYFLQTFETDPKYIHAFARIRKNGTLAVQRVWAEVDMHHGVFIDVFPLDNILPDTLFGRLQVSTCLLIRKLKIYKLKKSKCFNSKKAYKTAVKLLIHYMLKPVSMKNLNRVENMISGLFNGKDTQFVSVLTLGDKGVEHRSRQSRSEFTMLEEVEFEGRNFFAPRFYDMILTRIYGDYMSMPPEEDRIPHHGLVEVSL